MITSFEDAFAELMRNEGGYSNHPNDPGGETMFGVTERVARRYGHKGPMKSLPIDLAKLIAKTEYWAPYQCDQITPAIAFRVMDAAYHGGHPARWLQQACGAVVDGVVGANTIKAVRMMDTNKLIRRFDGYRLRYLAALNTWPTFGRGWANRIANDLLMD